MSQILTAAKRTVSKKSDVNYEDLDNTAECRRHETFCDGTDSLSHIGQELEMNSVSVVPDGTAFFIDYNILSFSYHVRWFHITPITLFSLLDTFTVSQAVNAFGFGKFQAKLSLFTGLCWMADSMEMTILSILSLALHCDWHISRYQQALATTV